jgi:uncharacterized protein
LGVREIDLEILHCYRCGNSWGPRSRIVRICSRCKSKLWDEPRLQVPTVGDGPGVEEVLGPHRERIAAIARRYGARELRVYGSVARRQTRASSDVDLLVTFDRRSRSKSTLRSLDFAQELEAVLGRRVDVATEESLHWYIQPQVIAEAIPL